MRKKTSGSNNKTSTKRTRIFV